MEPVELPNIRNITISGRIGCGATTLAHRLSETLRWEMLDGGKLFRKINQELGASVVETSKRPDHFDIEYEERIKNMLKEQKHQIIQSHLAGFDAQGIPGIYKVLVICEDNLGNDKAEIRIDRVVNRDGKSIDEAKHEIMEREKQNLEKWRRLYAGGDQNWMYWNKTYYDLVINTYSHNQDETLRLALVGLGLQT